MATAHGVFAIHRGITADGHGMVGYQHSTLLHSGHSKQVGPRAAEIAGLGLRYRVNEQTLRLGEYSDAPAATRTFENRLPDFPLTIGTRQFANGIDFIPVQGGVLSPPARMWTQQHIENLVEHIAGRLHELTREDLMWGGMGIALMFVRLGNRFADRGAWLPNHVLYARMALGITSEPSLRGSSAIARSEERCAAAEFSYAAPYPQLDTSPPPAPIALAQFEFLKAYMHANTDKPSFDDETEEGERKEAVRRFRRLEDEVMQVDNDEWMQGRSMYLSMALQLQVSFPADGILGGTVERVANAIFERSVEHGAQLYQSALDRYDKDPLHTSVPPLFCYTKDRWPWLGALRGLVGLLHTLLQVPSVLKDEAKLTLIRETIEWMLRQEREDGLFCSVAFSEPGEKPNWGNGAGGVVMLFAKAFEVFHDPKYANAAERTAERLWRYALVRNTDGLCEGTAGNAYAFLRMFTCARMAVERSVYNPMCTPEQWVHRAHMCTRFILESDCSRPAEFDMSFHDGKAGLVCLLLDMLEPGNSALPLFEIGRSPSARYF